MTNASAQTPALADATLASCTRWELVYYFLHLGAFGFGGPIALAGYMQRDLVEQKRWISRDDYMQGLA
ncbi:MAG TPA: chromate transporter, partial [Polyangiaceae bacterium]